MMNRKSSSFIFGRSRPGSSQAERRPAEQSDATGVKSNKEGAKAVEKLGWSSKFPGGKKKPKTLSPPQTVDDDNAESSRHRHRPQPLDKDKLSARQAIHGSRPGTPASGLAPPPNEYEIEDDLGSEVSSRRKSGTKPKLHRYWSNLTGGPQKEENFFLSEPWSEDFPLTFEPVVDPLVVVQSVRSHLSRISAEPIPVAQGSGILRVFEDYRKVREEKEKLDGLIKDTLDDYQTAEEFWNRTEERYQEEIRRLELIIARGASGMSALMKARQGSVIDKRRSHKKRALDASALTAFNFMAKDKLDEEILLRSQRGQSTFLGRISAYLY